MSADPTATFIDCATHGRVVGAVVCAHLLRAAPPAGFVENSSDPNDLQAWCFDCEAMFLREDGMTDAFRAFNDMRIVCVDCYHAIRQRHDTAGTC